MIDSQPAVVMDQGHARLHYAVPLSIHRAGMLRAAVCDYYSDGGPLDRTLRSLAGIVSRTASQRMADRNAADLPAKIIVQDRARTLTLDIARHVSKRAAKEHWDRWAAWRSPKIANTVRRRGANILHGYISSLHPPLLRQLRSRGTRCTGDQVIAPTHVLQREHLLQQERFGDWAAEGLEMELARLALLEQKTWPLLDHITCASSFVRSGLVEAGVEGARITVLPYPFARSQVETGISPEGQPNHPMTVGFVGSVSLRKGAPYFLKVARRLATPSLRFQMVGPIQLSEQILQEYGDCVDFVGAVSRRDVQDRLRGFDVFLFPSTCEGSAGVVYEAANAGVPVITSENSGTHLRAPEEVSICAYDDIDGICNEVDRLISSQALREARSSAAWRALGRCSIDAYSRGIAEVFRDTLELTPRA